MVLDLIIPTYKPDYKFDKLINRIMKQTVKPRNIIVINTNKSYFDESKYSNIDNMKIIHINENEFDHGGTRNYAASLSDADIIMFMTQDAVPKDKFVIKNILNMFKKNDNIAIVYGRQLADNSVGIIEKYTRNFNYPSKDYIKSKKDLKRLGIKTYFCSNVCAAYKNDIYKEIGGFIKNTIFNEDMIMAANVINLGYSIGYASNAKVIHAHNYNYIQQFQRNFDLAVSQKQNSYIFGNIKSETEGIRLIKQTIKYLIDINKPYLIIDLIMQSGFKYLGYKLGLNYDKLPKRLVVKFSMNKRYWKN